MAVTVTRKGNEIAVAISETSASSSTEATIPIGVQKARIMRQICQVTAGTAATVDPILTRTSGGSGINVVLENDTAAATCDNSVSGGVPLFVSDGVLYHKSTPNAGSDNAISTEYYILVGWE